MELAPLHSKHTISSTLKSFAIGYALRCFCKYQFRVECHEETCLYPGYRFGCKLTDTRVMLAGLRAVRCRSSGLRFEVPFASIFFIRQFNVLLSVQSSVRKLFNHLKRIKSLIAS